MELFDITTDDLDPLVDDVEGVAAFMSDATTGPITFI
jgi:peroxiredoxin family protein